MKKSDFIKEDHALLSDVANMARDHEVQMAREECYHIASNAIEMHKLLKNISEEQGLDGWVSEKISLANDYIRTVREYLEYEILSKNAAHLGEMASAGSTGSASIGAAPAQNLFQKKKVIKRKSK